ncbi:MAG: GNAT family protein [Nocardioides sp.]|uniref:GNAT family N-acetyltransferase n=1 Tax=Nocardioides sp. TaxID=35761 RepID=UPI0039E39BCF
MSWANELGQPVGDPVEGWVARSAPACVSLTGRYVRLEPVGPAHVDGLLGSVCTEEDESLWTYRSVPRPVERSEVTALVDSLSDQTPGVTFVVLPEGHQHAQGLVSLMRLDAANGCLEIGGIMWSRQLQRTRAATEALVLIATYVFDELGYRRLEWKCDSLNEPSRAAARRLGFSYEGRFRQALVVKGRNRDTDWFSIIDTEWPRLRAAYDAWLSPDNFDDDGGQVQPLSALTDRTNSEPRR